VRYADQPNAWGCYDPQCGDSTWDHECPTVPPLEPGAAIAKADLGPGTVALLDQNWSYANECLDELLRRNQEHRAEGCAHWYCADEEMNEALSGLEYHSLQMVLRAALERLTRQ
jgi:hypothetical protein